MYRRILVPVDGSVASTLGLKHALRLAQDQDASVRVLNILDVMLVAPLPEGYAAVDMSVLLDSLKSSGQKALDAAVTLAERAGVEAETVMVESRGRHVSETILKQAKTWRADLIVMGTHGRRGFSRLLLGSDAERVMREASVPILLVRGASASKKAGARRAAPRKSRPSRAGRR